MIRIGFGLAAALLVAACSKEHGRPTPTPQDAQLIAQQEERLKAALKVPDSAKFKDVFVSQVSGDKEVCGRLDALNSFGARTGYQRFIMGDAANVLESDYGSAKMNESWKQYCER
ncbi:MAG: hypothetical protein P4L83_10380 [Nevskia sp.]|nr:hypothetical protein [Nevskia sp.]